MSQQLLTLRENKFSTLIADVAKESGVKAYLVGGGLRDMLLGRQPQDLDFVLDRDVKDVATIFSSRIEGRFFWLDEQRCQGRVVKKTGQNVLTFDFALQRANDINNDLALRDFTINALALSLVDNASDIIDPLKGIIDLQQRSIRACSETSFDDDPLRLLRAFRLSVTLCFNIDSKTLLKISEKSGLLQKVAQERIRDELFLILGTENAGTALAEMRDAGLLGVIVAQCFSQKDDLVTMQERINDVRQVELVMNHPEMYFAGVGTRISDYLNSEVESGVTIGALLKLAVFLGSSSSAVEITAERLKLGKKAVRILASLVVTVPAFIEPGWNQTQRAVYKFFADHQAEGIALVIVAMSRNPLHRQLCSSIMQYYLTQYQPGLIEQLLTGEEVMNILGVSPGKPVGDAIDALNRAERMGIINTREEAIDYLTKKLLTKNEPVI